MNFLAVDRPANVLGRNNNFDLLRIAAAVQVIFVHSVEHLNPPSVLDRVVDVLKYFPGVPIFFFLSGLLISNAWQRNPSLRQYAVNRVLRIYPALWLCFTATLILVIVIVGFNRLSVSQLAVWSIAQISFFQFYNLEAFRPYGVGVVNGSLWTISVELQFYMIVPLLMQMIFNRRSAWVSWIFVLAAIAFRETYLFGVMDRASVAGKLIAASILPYVSLFCVGIMCQQHWSNVRRYVDGTFLIWLVGYFIVICLGIALGVSTHGNYMSALFYLPLCGVTLAAGYTATHLSKTLLNGNDLSYGIYLYHMPMVNIAILLGFTAGILPLFFVGLMSLAFAVCSWVFIEKPCLTIKYRFSRQEAQGQSSINENLHISDIKS